MSKPRDEYLVYVFVAPWVPLDPPVHHNFQTNIAISWVHPISVTAMHELGYGLWLLGFGQLQLLVSLSHLSHACAR